nr:3-dehydroquinate synthase II [Paenibacillus apiarius]
MFETSVFYKLYCEVFQVEKKMVWLDIRNVTNETKIVDLVNKLRIDYLLIKESQLNKLAFSKKTKLILHVDENKDEIPEYSKDLILFTTSVDFLKRAKSKGYRTAFYIFVKNHADMEAAWSESQAFDFLAVEFKDETNIPLELLIARLQEKQTKILKFTKNIIDAEISFGVMEVGSDGVIFSEIDDNSVIAIDKLLSKNERGKINLVKGKVTDIQHVGMGHRACIDTISLLGMNEGMIIGSTSFGGLLVSSETHYLPYMELRPFRVNAGAIHSYVWSADSMTSYLTELKAGSKVICVDTAGNTREVSVGRVKIEQRPLIKIEVEVMNKKINAIVQDDWHIRIFGGDGSPLNVSSIKIGDELLAYTCEGGRHVGIKIDESIEEK